MDQQQQRQQFVQQIQQATQRLQSAQSPQEQQRWADEVKGAAHALSSQGQGRTALTVEVTAPGPQALAQIAQQADQLPGVREISYRRDPDGTGRIRIAATQEALTQVTQTLQQVGRHVESAFSQSPSS